MFPKCLLLLAVRRRHDIFDGTLGETLYTVQTVQSDSKIRAEQDEDYPLIYSWTPEMGLLFAQDVRVKSLKKIVKTRS